MCQGGVGSVHTNATPDHQLQGHCLQPRHTQAILQFKQESGGYYNVHVASPDRDQWTRACAWHCVDIISLVKFN